MHIITNNHELVAVCHTAPGDPTEFLTGYIVGPFPNAQEMVDKALQEREDSICQKVDQMFARYRQKFAVKQDEVMHFESLVEGFRFAVEHVYSPGMFAFAGHGAHATMHKISKQFPKHFPKGMLGETIVQINEVLDEAVRKECAVKFTLESHSLEPEAPKKDIFDASGNPYDNLQD